MERDTSVVHVHAPTAKKYLSVLEHVRDMHCAEREPAEKSILLSFVSHVAFRLMELSKMYFILLYFV